MSVLVVRCGVWILVCDLVLFKALFPAAESYLILIRHGESMWNEKNLFTGCVDVPLTSKGVEEAIEAGKRIRHLPIDVVYISALIRSQMTAMLALTEHHCKKVFLHFALRNSFSF